MSLVQLERIAPGAHPSERIVAVRTTDGSIEEIEVSERSIVNGALEIHNPVDRSGDALLIEFPRESARGAWRAWVPAAAIRPSPREKSDHELRLESVLTRIATQSSEHFASALAKSGLAGWDPRTDS